MSAILLPSREVPERFRYPAFCPTPADDRAGYDAAQRSAGLNYAFNELRRCREAADRTERLRSFRNAQTWRLFASVFARRAHSDFRRESATCPHPVHGNVHARAAGAAETGASRESGARPCTPSIQNENRADFALERIGAVPR